MIYAELVVVTAIVSLIYGTGFFEEMDAAFNRKWKMMHLPKIVMCSQCATWWLCLGYIIITKEFSLLTVLFSIAMWYVSPVFSKAMWLITDALKRVEELVEKWLY